MALDVGDARIGVAVSRSGIIADTRETITRVGRKQTLDAIGKVLEEDGVTVCVLGLPLLEGGTEGEQAEKTRAFSRSLQRRFPTLRITFHDERYTSAQAKGMMGRDGGAKGRVDQLAAAIILQEWLDSAARTNLEQSAEDKIAT